MSRSPAGEKETDDGFSARLAILARATMTSWPWTYSSFERCQAMAAGSRAAMSAGLPEPSAASVCSLPLREKASVAPSADKAASFTPSGTSVRAEPPPAGMACSWPPTSR